MYDTKCIFSAHIMRMVHTPFKKFDEYATAERCGMNSNNRVKPNSVELS